MQRCTNYFVYAMPMGRLSIAADEAGICAIAFGDVAHDGPRRPSALTNKAATQLQEYFAGKRRFFDIPLSPHGTEFQLKVWKALETIPYGQTRTYAEIAEMVGSPKGFRAVGLANQQKPTAHCGAVPPRYWSRWQARGLRGRSENQEIPTRSRGHRYLENEIGQATRRRAIRSKQDRKGRHARYSNPTYTAKRRYGIPDELRTNVNLAYCPCEEAYRTRKEPLSGLFSYTLTFCASIRYARRRRRAA